MPRKEKVCSNCGHVGEMEDVSEHQFVVWLAGELLKVGVRFRMRIGKRSKWQSADGEEQGPIDFCTRVVLPHLQSLRLKPDDWRTPYVRRMGNVQAMYRILSSTGVQMMLLEIDG